MPTAGSTNAAAGFQVNENGVTGTAGVGIAAEANGVKISFGTEVSVNANAQSQNGVTTFTAVQLERHYNPDGTEDVSQRAFSMTMTGANVDAESNFAELYGSEGHAPGENEEVQLSFTSEGLMELSERARDHIERHERVGRWLEPTSDSSDDIAKLFTELADARTDLDVAQILMDAPGGPDVLGEAFRQLSGPGYGRPFPGSFGVLPSDS